MLYRSRQTAQLLWHRAQELFHPPGRSSRGQAAGRLLRNTQIGAAVELGAQHLFMAGINCLNRSINLQPSEVSRVDVPLIKANILLRQKGKAPLEQQSLGAGRTWVGARDFTSSFLLNESPGTWALCG